jgi:signal transduction histidine kinase
MKLSKLSRDLFLPRSTKEDIQRREFILNVLLAATITLLTLAMVSSVITSFITNPESRSNNAMSLLVVAGILLFTLYLYWTARKGNVLTASMALIAVFFLLSAYMGYRWGPDVTMAILLYSLTIVMAGVLIGSRAALVVAILFSLYIPFTNALQLHHIIPLNSYWRQTPLLITDAIIMSVVLFFTATVSWLSNREIEKSLVRARASEAALKEERDMLEIRVEERTREWRKAEIENLTQTYRFVEFGRVASGLFHDLGSPLTALSLNIESMAQNQAQDTDTITALGTDIDRAKRSISHIQKVIDSMRRHLSHEEVLETFSLRYSLSEVVNVFTTYARERKVQLILTPGDDVDFYGDPSAFVQVATNLLSNAIESFPIAEDGSDSRTVTVSLATDNDTITLTISDTGSGMSEETQRHMFDAFFTTKERSRGLGIGLLLVKRLLEKKFDGTILVTSTEGKGSTFTVYFPVREP